MGLEQEEEIRQTVSARMQVPMSAFVFEFYPCGM